MSTSLASFGQGCSAPAPSYGLTLAQALRSQIFSASLRLAGHSGVRLEGRRSELAPDGARVGHGSIDILVNCAGVNSAVPYEEIDDDWQTVLETNLKATHLGCQIFAAVLAAQENGCSILNIGSVTAHLPLSRVFAYSDSKAALNNLTKNVAREYATRGVRVNTLNPGFFPAAEPQDPPAGARAEDHGSDPDGSLRRAARAGGCDSVAGGSQCRKLRHRGRGLCGRRLHWHALLGASQLRKWRIVKPTAGLRPRVPSRPAW